MIDQDYDEDGNNIVPCPICGDVYCPGKDDGECPEEEAFIRSFDPIDLVYVYRSTPEDYELRYSLRSVEQHFPHRNIVIVGDRPDWLQNVIHINQPDNFANVKGGKYKNVLKKTIAACNDDRVSDRFVLMNDDFFFLEDCKEIAPFTMGSLQSVIDFYRKRYNEPTGGRNQYINMLTRTMRFLRKADITEPKSYNVHVPIVYEKAKFIDMVDRVDWLAFGYSWRSLYGNLYNIGSVERTDPKVSSKTDVLRLLSTKKHGDFLSIGDNVAQDRRFRDWIEDRFPNKSKYEN